MEYSISKAIQNLRPTITKRAYPRLSPTPARNIVFPGFGHIIRKTNYIVLLPNHHNIYQVSKKIEEQPEDDVLLSLITNILFYPHSCFFSTNWPLTLKILTLWDPKAQITNN